VAQEGEEMTNSKVREQADEIERLKKELQDAKMAANSSKLLYAIRKALGLNEYFPLSHLDSKVAEVVRQRDAAYKALDATCECRFDWGDDKRQPKVVTECFYHKTRKENKS
jgi:hypothetical protein